MDGLTLNTLLVAGGAVLIAALYFMLKELRRIPREYKAEYMQTIFSGILAGLVFNLLNSMKAAISLDDIPNILRDLLLVIILMIIGAYYYARLATLKSKRKR